MASITHQTSSVKSILDIYNKNPSYQPTLNSLMLLSTPAGTTAVAKLEDVVLNSPIFEEPISSYYNNGDCFKNTKKIKD